MLRLDENYRMHFHVTQTEAGEWCLGLEYYVSTEDGGTEPIVVYSYRSFETYEQAVEAGCDMLEILGFEIQDTIAVNLLSYTDESQQVQVRHIFYDGQNFLGDPKPGSFEGTQ